MLSRLSRPPILLAVSACAAAAMVNNQSLWIDEAVTASYASKPTFDAWLRAMFETRWSEAMMPLYTLVAWISGRLIGTEEWQLRSLNVLWTAFAGLAMGLAGRRLNLPLLLPFFLIQPFLWYYTNEARPYAMQICAAAWLLYGIASLASNPADSRPTAWILASAAVVGFGSSLLFGFALPALLAAVWFACRDIEANRFPPSTQWFLPLVVSLIALATLTGYYFWTLQRGASGARIWNVSLANTGFAFYELLGFGGLGPPRNELREQARSSGLLHLLLQPRHLIGLGLLAAACGVVCWRLWLARWDRTIAWAGMFVVTQTVLLFAVCSVARFPFWGRHLAPALPFIVLLTARLLAPKDQNSRLASRMTASILGACLLFSCLILRFDPAYGKDDYRTASQLAADAVSKGKIIWWNADPEAAAYYGLRGAFPPSDDSHLLFCNAPSLETLNLLPTPDIVFQSKPDVYDPQIAVKTYLDRNGYVTAHEFPAFKVWTRKNAGHAAEPTRL